MCAGLSPGAEGAVRLRERFLGADVEPLSGHAPTEHRRARVEPLNEAPGLVGVVTGVEVLPDEAERRARVEVHRDPGPGAARLLGLFLQPRHAVIAVEL